MTLSLTINETLKWLSSLPILMQGSFWWWQYSDRYIISLSPHFPTPFPHHFSPSLIRITVSVDVKHHVYLLLFLRMYLWWSLCTLCLHACQVKVIVGDSVLCCCTCVTYFEHYWINSPVCWFARALRDSYCFRFIDNTLTTGQLGRATSNILIHCLYSSNRITCTFTMFPG